MDENQVCYKRIPPHNPDCNKIFSGNAPKLISPINGNEYFIEKANPQPVLLSCETAQDVQFVFWWVNNKMVAKAKAGEKVFQLLPEGNVKVSCADDKGRNTDVWVRVTEIDY
jgi:penicillin-binding protein 1C